MVDISSKVNKIIEMVDRGDYFTINRPRQFGKTTTFNQLIRELDKKYIIIKTSFEGIGDDIFETEEKFCEVVFRIFARSSRFTNKDLYNKLKFYQDKTKNFNDLSENITYLIEEYDKDMILIIDEVDKSSGNRIFMQFLGLLRNKYLAQNAKEDLTFKNVILGGVNGEAYRLKGLNQLSNYMEEQKVQKGYLLVFNFNKNKKYTKEWIDLNDKKIFEVVV